MQGSIWMSPHHKCLLIFKWIHCDCIQYVHWLIEPNTAYCLYSSTTTFDDVLLNELLCLFFITKFNVQKICFSLFFSKKRSIFTFWIFDLNVINVAFTYSATWRVCLSSIYRLKNENVIELALLALRWKIWFFELFRQFLFDSVVVF